VGVSPKPGACGAVVKRWCANQVTLTSTPHALRNFAKCLGRARFIRFCPPAVAIFAPIVKYTSATEAGCPAPPRRDMLRAPAVETGVCHAKPAQAGWWGAAVLTAPAFPGTDPEFLR
jgi:hypothetical protein